MGIDELPVEILVRIFSALRDEQTNMYIHSDPWIVVTHVCRSWRSVALGAAELWTKINSRREDVVRAYVERSQQAPLEIDYTHDLYFESGTLIKPIWDILSPQSHRIRDIVASVDDVVYPFFQHLLRNGAPLLVSAELSFYMGSLSVGALMQIEAQTQITDFETYRRGFPVLRDLSISGWPHISVPSLRTLVKPSLRSLTITMPLRALSLSVWTSVLQELPLLEKLILLNALAPSPLSFSSEHPPTIDLPHLSFLQIRGSHPDEQVLLLQRIHPARDVRVVFHVHSSPYHEPLDFPMALFVQALSEKYSPKARNIPSPTLLEFDIFTVSSRAIGSGTEMRVKLSAPVIATRCPEHESINTAPILRIDLRGLRLSPNDVCRPIYHMLSTIFPLSAVKTLYLCHGIETVPESWRNIFLQMTHLDTIFIKRSRSLRIADDLLRMLGVSEIQASNTGPAAPSRLTLFPALQLLSIQELNSPNSINFDLLLEVLRSRKDAGHGISSIHICPLILRRDREAEVRSKLLAFKTSLDCHADYCVLVDMGESRWDIESL
ncbi:hypothetical protein EIP86_001168 [Pleurotus ostreatoroseus]|nr:hypothetical protein EIP86_001168 [Pleurotus ostreatoroseus]